MRNQYFNYFIIIFFSLIIYGCAGSKVSTVQLELTRHKGMTFNVMPFNSDFISDYYDDIRLKQFDGFLVDYIQNKIQDNSGAFTYTFDTTDIANLRSSLLISLRNAEHYKQIRDIDSAEIDKIADGLKLFVEFERMGVSQDVAFIVEIIGKTRVTDSSGRLLGERIFHIKEKGLWTLAAGKEKAIDSFIMEVSMLLNDI